MNDNTVAWNVYIVMIFILMTASIIITLPTASGAPQGPVITYNATYNITPQPAAEITTAGGSFTVLRLNATSQTPRWKAYVGNVSGKLVLDDATSYSIFDWSVTSVTGEVYATRNTSISWTTITCADTSVIYDEESSLNMSISNADTVNKTFMYRKHKRFYVGSVLVQNSTCPSFATYVNDSAQSVTENASFQEILLKDSSSQAIYTTLINANTTGFNNQKYDFQMIVPENEYQQTPSTYYLYVELI